MKTLTGSVLNWGDEGAVFAALQSILDHLDSDKREGLAQDEPKDIFKQMKQNKNPADFYDYLYGFDYLDTKYDLKVDQKDLRKLSAGERGGLLPILYLMLDKRDIPLVIDQPEDNLDNETVYRILVTFSAKLATVFSADLTAIANWDRANCQFSSEGVRFAAE